MLFFNAKKFQYLILEGCLGLESELYNENSMKTDVFTDLGLVKNSNLNWNNHLETKLSKAQKVYQMERRNSASNASTQSILYVMDFHLLTAGFFP